MEKLKSEGVCLFCEKTYTKSGINRHLQKHLEAEALQGKPGISYLLKIEMDTSWGRGPYFLSLWMDGEAKMKSLDVFLRQIWLECCGHMSSFTDPKKRNRGMGFDYFEAHELLDKGETKKYEALMEESNGEIPMSRKAKKIFHKGLKLIYKYDFGSTTSLEVVVVGEYKVQAKKEIVLLSRNEPLHIICSTCGDKNATQICSQCSYNEDAEFCKQCAEEHSGECEDFGDYAAMGIVNSPRMGVCGYEGGSIDIQRDLLK